ncbi:hypothetical protein BJ878DRAFT_400409, partial [Calycina marina]
SPTCSFPKFSELPAELRCEIWKIASFHPRNVPIDVQYKCNTFTNYLYQDHIFISPLYPPAILHSSQESRIEALKYYQRSFNKTV